MGSSYSMCLVTPVVFDDSSFMCVLCAYLLAMSPMSWRRQSAIGENYGMIGVILQDVFGDASSV